MIRTGPMTVGSALNYHRRWGGLCMHPQTLQICDVQKEFALTRVPAWQPNFNYNDLRRG